MMKILLILLGIVLLIAGWFAGLVADGWNAPEGKIHRGPTITALLGAGCIVAVFFI